MEHGAALECKDTVGQRQHDVEIVFDDDDGDVPPQPVERLEEFIDDCRRASRSEGPSSSNSLTLPDLLKTHRLSHFDVPADGRMPPKSKSSAPDIRRA